MKNKIFAMFALSTCVGCASVDPLEQPKKFNVEQHWGVLTGAYNPDGFDTAKVKDALTDLCRPPVMTEYKETERADGLIEFRGQCRESYVGVTKYYVVSDTRFGIVVDEVKTSLFDNECDPNDPYTDQYC